MNENLPVSVFLSMAASDSKEDQAKRISKAASAECTPLSVSKEEGYALFSGSHGKYTTRLDFCECGDFRKRGGAFPCKHMYRLAYELGVFDLPGVVSDSSKIKDKEPTSKERAASYEKCIALISGYSEETRMELWKLLAARFKKEVYVCGRVSVLAPAFSDGLVEYAERKYVLLKKSKKWVSDAMEKKGFSFPEEAGKTQKDRYAWCVDHAEEVCPLICPKSYAVKTAGDFEIANKKIYTYLRKEFYVETVFYV